MKNNVGRYIKLFFHSSLLPALSIQLPIYNTPDKDNFYVLAGVGIALFPPEMHFTLHYNVFPYTQLVVYHKRLLPLSEERNKDGSIT